MYYLKTVPIKRYTNVFLCMGGGFSLFWRKEHIGDRTTSCLFIGFRYVLHKK